MTTSRQGSTLEAGALPQGALGGTGLRVSRLGVGTGTRSAADGTEGLGASLARAWQLGARYVDTAPLYLGGASEHLVGEFLRRGDGDRAVVSTKVGRLPDAGGRRRFDYSAAGTRASLTTSLQRLGRSRLDVVLVHDIDAAMHGDGDGFEAAYRAVVEECWPVLQEWRADGRIGAVGVSARQSEVCRRAIADMDLDCVMMAGSYTLLRHEPAEGLFGLCLEREVSVLLAAPFHGGLLAGATPSRAVDHAPPHAEELAVPRLAEVARRWGVPLAAVALQFPLRHPAVASVVVGQRSPAEVEANVAGLGTHVPAGLWEQLVAEGLVPGGERRTAPDGVRR